jgi:hypothetical protein
MYLARYRKWNRLGQTTSSYPADQGATGWGRVRWQLSRRRMVRIATDSIEVMRAFFQKSHLDPTALIRTER